MPSLRLPVLAALFLMALSVPASAATPPARAATTCSDYSNQADAQRGAPATPTATACFVLSPPADDA